MRLEAERRTLYDRYPFGFKKVRHEVGIVRNGIPIGRGLADQFSA